MQLGTVAQHVWVAKAAMQAGRVTTTVTQSLMIFWCVHSASMFDAHARFHGLAARIARCDSLTTCLLWCAPQPVNRAAIFRLIDRYQTEYGSHHVARQWSDQRRLSLSALMDAVDVQRDFTKAWRLEVEESNRKSAASLVSGASQASEVRICVATHALRARFLLLVVGSVDTVCILHARAPEQVVKEPYIPFSAVIDVAEVDVALAAAASKAKRLAGLSDVYPSLQCDAEEAADDVSPPHVVEDTPTARVAPPQRPPAPAFDRQRLLAESSAPSHPLYRTSASWSDGRARPTPSYAAPTHRSRRLSAQSLSDARPTRSPTPKGSPTAPPRDHDELTGEGGNVASFHMYMRARLAAIQARKPTVVAGSHDGASVADGPGPHKDSKHAHQQLRRPRRRASSKPVTRPHPPSSRMRQSRSRARFSRHQDTRSVVFAEDSVSSRRSYARPDSRSARARADEHARRAMERALLSSS